MANGWSRVVVVKLALIGALVVPSAASAAVLSPIAIGSNTMSDAAQPGVAVDASGNAYIAWDSPTNTAVEEFCKLALTAKGCTPVQLTAPDSGQLASFGIPSVILQGSKDVYVFRTVEAATSDDVEGLDEWVSTNSGASFTADPAGGYSVANLPEGEDTLNPVMLLPGGDFGYGGVVAGGNPEFQANSLTSPTENSVAADGPYATLNPNPHSYNIGNLGGSVAAQLTGTEGVLGVFESLPDPGLSPCPSSDPSSLVYAWGAIGSTQSGSQIVTNLNTNPGTGTAWHPLSELDCFGDYPAVGGGPSGLGVLETNQTSLLDPIIEYRRFTPPSTFGAPVPIVSPESSLDGSLSQDGGGGVYATWLDPDTGVNLAYSSTHGVSWDGPIVLLGNDGGELGVGALSSAVDSVGVGWAAYAVNGTEYAQPFNAEETLPVPKKPTNTSKPGLSGTPAAGKTLTCSPGTWTGNPTLTYEWYRNGTLLAGVVGATYTVGTVDEGSTFKCVVIATNTAGSASATSNSKTIKIPYVKHCAPATGKMTGKQIGLLKLNMTRKQARYVYRDHSTRGFQYKDFFCLTPEGIRAGYATPKLLKTLPKRERKKYSDRVVWASTSDPYYSLDGVRAGESITTAAALLHTERPLHIGKNYWYLAVKHGYTAVLKVRGIQVQELGIADNSLTKTRADQSNLMHSFY